MYGSVSVPAVAPSSSRPLHLWRWERKGKGWGRGGGRKNGYTNLRDARVVWWVSVGVASFNVPMPKSQAVCARAQACLVCFLTRLIHSVGTIVIGHQFILAHVNCVCVLLLWWLIHCSKLMMIHSWPYARLGTSMTTTYELWIVDLDTVHFHGQYTTYIACVLSIVFPWNFVSQNGQSPTTSQCSTISKHCSTYPVYILVAFSVGTRLVIFLVSCRSFSWHPTSGNTGHMIYQLVPFVIQNSWQLHDKSMSLCCLRLGSGQTASISSSW